MKKFVLVGPTKLHSLVVAMACAGLVPAQNASDGKTWFERGTALNRQGRIVESREAYQKALDQGFQPLQAMATIARSWP